MVVKPGSAHGDICRNPKIKRQTQLPELKKGSLIMKTFEFGNPNSSIVLIQPVDDHDLEGIENEYTAIISNCNICSCSCIKRVSLSLLRHPWPADKPRNANGEADRHRPDPRLRCRCDAQPALGL